MTAEAAECGKTGPDPATLLFMPPRRRAVDRLDPTPLSEQLAEVLINLLDSGVYQLRDKLPSEAELRTLYLADPNDEPISRVTVRNALALLAATGLITSFAGRGSYVSASPEQVRQILAKAGQAEGQVAVRNLRDKNARQKLSDK